MEISIDMESLLWAKSHSMTIPTKQTHDCILLQCTTHGVFYKNAQKALLSSHYLKRWHKASAALIYLPLLLALVIRVELLDILNILRTAQEDGTSAVNRSGNNVKNTLRTGSSNTSRLKVSTSSLCLFEVSTNLLGKESHWEGFVKHSQFTYPSVWIHTDTRPRCIDSPSWLFLSSG